MDRPHGHDLRRGRCSEPGRSYLVTAVAEGRRPVFQDFSAARICVNALRYQDEAGRSETLAFVVMPDHLHWLVTLRRGTLAALLHSVKGHAARRINRQRGASGALWQSGYHDHTLRTDEDLRGVARYVVANPVRAGIVRRLWDYPHWDAVWVE